MEPDQLPWAALRLTDEGVRGGQAVEVLLAGEPIARLPACRVGYELNVHGRGILTVGVHAQGDITIDGGDAAALELRGER